MHIVLISLQICIAESVGLLVASGVCEGAEYHGDCGSHDTRGIKVTLEQQGFTTDGGGWPGEQLGGHNLNQLGGCRHLGQLVLSNVHEREGAQLMQVVGILAIELP